MNDLYDALRERAESAPLQSADLGTIRARARSIRRRRAAVAVGSSAVAVAVIAGLGFALAPHGADHAVPPIASTSAVPTQTASGSDIGTHFSVRTTNLAVEDTTGSEPGLPYWDGSNLVAPNGSAVPWTERPKAVALDPATGEWLVLYGTDGTDLARLSATGKPVGSPVPSVDGGLFVAPDGTIATITRLAGGWTLTAGDRGFDLGDHLDPYARIDAILANGDVAFSSGGPDERVAHLSNSPITKIDGASFVRTSPAGQVALALDDGSWLTKGADGLTDWTVSWAGVSGFSTDGTYVALVGDRANRVPGSFYWDEPGVTSTLWIRAAADDGPVAVFTAPKGGFFSGWTWEGDDILTLLFERDSETSPNGTWSLVRLSPDGFQVVRGASRPGRIDAPPYVIGAGVTQAP